MTNQQKPKRYIPIGRNRDGYIFFAEVVEENGEWVLVPGDVHPVPLYLLPKLTISAINMARDWLRDKIKELYYDGEVYQYYGYHVGDVSYTLLPLNDASARAIKALGFSSIY